MLSVEEASKTVAARIERLAVERVSLQDARGRILAADVIASRPLPSFDNSAMDGYAARSAELPATLPVVASVAAGHALGGSLPAGVAVRILTGAPVPPGLDTVVMQEDATVAHPPAPVGDVRHASPYIAPDGPVPVPTRVTLPAAQVGENIRRAGEDIAVGEIAVRAGSRLDAGELGLLAALGVTQLSVRRAPRVAIIATGDELVSVDTPLAPGQIVDSSAHSLAALIADCGGVPHYLGIAKDDLAATTVLITSALDHDVVITTGGVSVGDRDHVRAALAAAGVEPELWKVAMKPGKPFAFGLRGNVPVFGLPGNPVSTYVAFELFVRPALLAMQGATITTRPRAPVSLAGGYRKQAGRTHYLRATVVRMGAQLVAKPHPKQGSAMLTSLVGCNALVEIPAEATEVLPNAIVESILLGAV